MTAPRTVLDVLVAARELISVPERWTVGTFARNSAGAPAMVSEPSACRFCVLGALLRAEGKTSSDRSVAEEAIESAIGTPSVAGWQDTHTHADVLAAFDRAIAAERARQ